MHKFASKYLPSSNKHNSELSDIRQRRVHQADRFLAARIAFLEWFFELQVDFIIYLLAPDTPSTVVVSRRILKLPFRSYATFVSNECF